MNLKNINRLTSVFLLSVIVSLQLGAQPKYELSVKKDVPLLVAGVSGLLLTRMVEHKLPGLSQVELDNLPAVNALDRSLTPAKYYESVDKISDYYIFTEILSSLVVMGIKAPEKEKLPVLVMAVEGYLLNQAVTDMVKLIAKRPRPYMHDANSPYNRFETDGRLSFFSGHTSNAAMFGFLTTSVLHRYDVMNKKTAIISAAALPVIMGLARIFAGQHYFTDVFTGALSGASIGLILPYLHKPKNGN